MKLSRRKFILGLQGAILSSPSQTVFASEGRCRVAGPTLLIGDEPGILMGVDVGDPLTGRKGRPDADFDRLATDWLARVVRVSVHPGHWRAERESAAAALSANVEAALAAGLRVIIDWHVIGWPDGAYEHPAPSWGMPDDIYDSGIDLARSFWRFMARRYGGHPRVIFELWNEPVLLSPTGRVAAHGEDWRGLRPVWEDLIAEIRRSADNLVLATGGRWASDLTGIRGALLSDANTAYSWHIYPGSCGGSADGWRDSLDGLSEVRPVFVTEWGYSDTPGTFYSADDGYASIFPRDFLIGQRLHWTAWCWIPKWEPSLLMADWRSPTAAGKRVMSLLHRSSTVPMSDRP